MKFAKYYDRRVGGMQETLELKVAGIKFPMPSLSSTWLPTQLLSESVSSLPLYQWGSNLDLNHVAKL